MIGYGVGESCLIVELGSYSRVNVQEVWQRLFAGEGGESACSRSTTRSICNDIAHISEMAPLEAHLEQISICATSIAELR